MTLTPLIAQRRYWALPLALALAVSWCLVYCLPPGQVSQAGEPVPTSVAQSVPDCHGSAEAQPQGTESHSQHGADDCPGCDRTSAESTSPVNPLLASAALSSWPADEFMDPRSAVVQGVIPPPIPPPKQRLHLLHQVFLI